LIDVKEKSAVSIKTSIEIPSNAPTGKYKAKFKAVTEKANTDNEIIIVVEKGETAAKIRTSTPEIVAKPGDEIKLSLDLENKGDKDEYYLLGYKAPADWKVEFHRGNFKVPSVLVAKESSVSLEASVKIPSNAKLGTYTLIFIAEKENREALELNTTVQVEGSYSLILELSRLYTQIVAGEKKELIARVANKGKNPVTKVELEFIVIPNNWQYEISPKSIERINAGDAGDFKILLLSSPDAGIGDYFLKLKAKSEQAKSEEITLRVAVQKEDSFGVIGIGIIFASLFVLFLIYKIFGRK